jgi:hypothetical protein
MRSNTQPGGGAEVLSTRAGGSRSLRDPISSAWLVDAFLLGGFEVFRVDASGTILEREGGRAVVVPHGARMRRDMVDDLRRIAGVTAAELDALLARAADPSG